MLRRWLNRWPCRQAIDVLIGVVCPGAVRSVTRHPQARDLRWSSEAVQLADMDSCDSRVGPQRRDPGDDLDLAGVHK